MTNKDNESNNVKTEKVDHFKGSDAVEAKPIQVVVFNPSQPDRAFEAFKAIVQKERVIADYKKSLRYEKPGDKKRRKRNEAKRKLLELEMKRKRFEAEFKTVEKQNG